jgi:hypothetical protein
MSPDAGGVKMFTQRCDIGQSWNGTNCTGTRIAPTWNNGSATWTPTNLLSAVTGQANTTALTTAPLNVDGGAPYYAAQDCDTLNENGHTDWYLPARNELNVLYTGKTAIGNFDVSGSSYWSSTEGANNTYAWYERFSDGYQSNYVSKNSSYILRCVRR